MNKTSLEYQCTKKLKKLLSYNSNRYYHFINITNKTIKLSSRTNNEKIMGVLAHEIY